MVKVIIIAEAGVNHNGDLNIAKKLIDAAAVAGADFIKFQTFKASKITSSNARMADYQKTNLESKGSDSQFSMLKKLELSEEWHYQLKEYCNISGIKFLSTGFDEDSIDFLETLEPELYKIPSGEITNKPYLEHVADKGKEIILSTGISDLTEIKNAINVIESRGLCRSKITVLHCTSEYPTSMIDVNLKAMNTIQVELNVNVGYSDHTPGIEVPIAAVALGAKVIEKHLTLNRSLPGPDHKASLEPLELKRMVSAVRNIELAISGDGKKLPTKSELKNKDIIRKSIHAKRVLVKGTKITKKDIIMLRPGDGISPMDVDNIIGSFTTRNIRTYEKISWSDFTRNE